MVIRIFVTTNVKLQILFEMEGWCYSIAIFAFSNKFFMLKVVLFSAQNQDIQISCAQLVNVIQTPF